MVLRTILNLLAHMMLGFGMGYVGASVAHFFARRRAKKEMERETQRLQKSLEDHVERLNQIFGTKILKLNELGFVEPAFPNQDKQETFH